jgi:hypothetical protein
MKLRNDINLPEKDYIYMYILHIDIYMYISFIIMESNPDRLNGLSNEKKKMKSCSSFLSLFKPSLSTC